MWKKLESWVRKIGWSLSLGGFCARMVLRSRRTARLNLDRLFLAAWFLLHRWKPNRRNLFPVGLGPPLSATKRDHVGQLHWSDQRVATCASDRSLQLPSAHFRDFADHHCYCWKCVGVPQCLFGEGFKNYNELLYSESGFCGFTAGGAGSAALCLRRGKMMVTERHGAWFRFYAVVT